MIVIMIIENSKLVLKVSLSVIYCLRFRVCIYIYIYIAYKNLHQNYLHFSLFHFNVY